MKENNQKRIILSIMAIAVLIAVLAAGTYAFFAATISGDDTSTSIQITASSDGSTIRFTGGETVNLTGIYPRSAAWLTKDITLSTTAVSGATSKPVYSFNIVVTDNDYELEDIQYTFTNKDHTGVDAGYTEVSKKTNMETMFDIAHGTVDLTQNATITYTLNVYFVNAEDRNQNTENDRNLRFYISYNWGNPVNVTTNIDGVQKTYKIPENSSIYLNTPRKEGYDFLRWTVSGGTLVGNKLSIGKTAVTLTANFQKQIKPESFATDSWETIATAVRNGNTSAYKVGDTREITINHPYNSELKKYNGTYTLRIMNNSNYDCNLPEQSACGFVVQFVTGVRDELYKIYHENGNYTDYNLFASYFTKHNLYGTLYDSLPYDLRSVMISTKVYEHTSNLVYYADGYGQSPAYILGTAAWNTLESIDGGQPTFQAKSSSRYLYLLDPMELYGEIPNVFTYYENGSYAEFEDNWPNRSRQLDFYAGGFEYDGKMLSKVVFNENTSAFNYPKYQFLRHNKIKNEGYANFCTYDSDSYCTGPSLEVPYDFNDYLGTEENYTFAASDQDFHPAFRIG